MLAVLLLNVGQTMSPQLLIDRVWGEQQPATVRNSLYRYLARLRNVIAAAADPQVRLARSPGGYLLRAPVGQLDLHRFRRLAADAASADDDQSAAARLREALGLWRGPALAGLDSPWLRVMRDTLEAERTVAVLDLNDVRLRLGEHAALVSELSGQAADSYPADERLVGQLMLALYRSGRQAGLGWFEQTRQQLADEFGTEPGPELRLLHQQILRADPALAARGPTEPGAARIASPPVPRQLPLDICAFTGRTAELAWLDQLIGTADANTAVISAVSGTAGVGKTALALHWAHQAAGHFPDGQLYVNLRGYDASGVPAAPAEAVRGFLDALGVPPARIPPATDAQTGLYRSLLADRRMLIVLDNARDEGQVRSLLPASPASLVIVTSRNELTGLAADGARLLSLDVLSHNEAIQLLSARIGTCRAAGPGAVDEIAILCAHLPVALAVAAARAAGRPRFPLTELAAELRDAAGRLDALDTGDPAVSVRAVFSPRLPDHRARTRPVRLPRPASRLRHRQGPRHRFSARPRRRHRPSPRLLPAHRRSRRFPAAPGQRADRPRRPQAWCCSGATRRSPAGPGVVRGRAPGPGRHCRPGRGNRGGPLRLAAALGDDGVSLQAR